MRFLALLALCAGCASFEDPAIVLDLRVIAVETTPPEQILDLDADPTIEEILPEMRAIRVRALVADPGHSGDLAWTMTACILDEGSRCVAGGLAVEFAAGIMRDPELDTRGEPCPDGIPERSGVACGLLLPDNRIVQMMYDALMKDPARGLGGIDLGISVHVQHVDPSSAAPDVFAAKHVRFAPRIPVTRVPNNNPHVEELLIGTGDVGFDLRRHDCNESGSIDTVEMGESFTLFPLARTGDNERYVLPTLDGESEQFQEYLEYQWIATDGSFTDEVTGGGPDVFGNVRLDGTRWKAPERAGRVTVWVVQRDGRYGVRWREGCIMVVP